MFLKTLDKKKKNYFEKSELNFEQPAGTKIYMAKLTVIYIETTNYKTFITENT